MFDKILTNADIYRGPAQGHSGGEHGDNWNDAVEKINGNFEKAAKALANAGVAGPNADYAMLAEDNAALRSDVESAAGVIGDLRMQVEELTKTVNSMASFFEPQGEPHATGDAEPEQASS